MVAKWMDDVEAVCLRPLPGSFDFRERRHDKAKMVERLCLAATDRASMKREIVASGGQVNVVRIGLPYDLHTKDALVKFTRPFDVRDLESEMAKSAMAYHKGAPYARCTFRRIP